MVVTGPLYAHPIRLLADGLRGFGRTWAIRGAVGLIAGGAAPQRCPEARVTLWTVSRTHWMHRPRAVEACRVGWPAPGASIYTVAVRVVSFNVVEGVGFRVRSRVQSITPKRAVELLEANTTNRPLSAPVVRAFAEAMKRGDWLVTHQGIAFDTKGVLSTGSTGWPRSSRPICRLR
jgi:hypothetical protein